jgi:hypothetical protein
VLSSSKSKLLFIFEYILAVEVKDVAEAGVIVEANEADDNDEDDDDGDAIDCVLKKLGCVAMQHFDVRRGMCNKTLFTK